MQPTPYSAGYYVQRGDVPPHSLTLATFVVAIIAFVFRFLSHDRFSNDHYVALSQAQALLLGDWPVRDYTVTASPLMSALSAGAQLLIGRTLLAEVLLTVTALSVAAAATCWAAGRLTGSTALGVLASFAQVAAFPLLYEYLNVTLYPILFLIAWRYLRRPHAVRMAALGAWTVFAFLLRYDHGVYTAIGALAAVVIAHWSEGIPRVLRYGAIYALMTLLAASPFLWYVERQVGLVDYLRTWSQASRADANRAGWMRPTFAPIRSGPLAVLRPRAAEDLPAITIRWRTGLPEQARLEHERALGLRYPERQADGVSWRYRVDPPARETLARVVNMPDAMGTTGFDRRSLGLETVPSAARRAVLAWNLDRIVPGPPLEDAFGYVNSTALLFWVLWNLPLVTIAIWMLRGRSCPLPLHCGPEVLLLAAIAMPTVVGLVRSPTQPRVSAGFGMAPILAAWVVAATMTARPRFVVTRAALSLLAIAGGLVLLIAVASMASLRGKIDQARLREPAFILTHAREVFQRSSTWPWAGEWPGGGGSELVAYLNRCTTSDDRLLVLWNAPQFNVFARRAFAGGETLLMPILRPTATYEPAVLARLDRQAVPLVLADLDVKPEFDRAYPQVASRLASRYREARVFTYDGGQRIGLFVDGERPQLSLDREFSLPCFGP